MTTGRINQVTTNEHASPVAVRAGRVPSEARVEWFQWFGGPTDWRPRAPAGRPRCLESPLSLLLGKANDPEGAAGWLGQSQASRRQCRRTSHRNDSIPPGGESARRPGGGCRLRFRIAYRYKFAIICRPSRSRAATALEEHRIAEKY